VNKSVNGTTTDISRTFDGTQGPCADKDGWYYSPDKTTITLCPKSCSDLSSGNGQVQLVLGCPTVVQAIN